MYRLGLVLCALCLICLACLGEADPLPTPLDPQQLASQRAIDHTQTAMILMTQQTQTPTPSPFTPSRTPTLTRTPRPSLTPSESPSPTITPSPTATTPIPTRTYPVISLTPSHTPSPTPSASPTRVLDPDALIINDTALLPDPRADAETVMTLTAGTAVQVAGRSGDERYYRVAFGLGGGGWVSAADVLILIDLEAVPVLDNTPNAPAAGASRILNPPPTIPAQAQGSGFPFQPYDFAACGDTYWLGDDLGNSMESLAYQGRYPRFADEIIQVYVHGLANLPPEAQTAWELAISRSFAELSQAVRLERVFTDDLEFFQPFVPMETLLLEERADMVWHITDPALYQTQSPCVDSLSCGEFGLLGTIAGGPLLFGGMVYIPNSAPNPQQALLTAALPALGLTVQSNRRDDMMAVNSSAERLSARDIRTLRCLYAAPPYGAR